MTTIRFCHKCQQNRPHRVIRAQTYDQKNTYNLYVCAACESNKVILLD